MKKMFPLQAVCLALMLAHGEAGAVNPFSNAGKDTLWPYTLSDLLLLRPFGLGLTAVGASLFVATSPLIGLANVAPPHDAFDKAATALILAPYGFTFQRPLGVFDYEQGGHYPTPSSLKPVPQAPVPMPQVNESRIRPATR